MDTTKKNKIIAALKKHNGNATAAAKELDVPPRTMRRWVAENNLRLQIDDTDADKRKVTSQKQKDGTLSPDALHLTPEELMEAYNLGDDYFPVKLDISERDAGTASAPKVSRGISLTVQKKPELPEPAFEGRPITIKPRKRSKKKQKKTTELVLVISDYHAPYVDWDLHNAALRLIEENEPNRIIVNGDLVDFPTVGRHRQTTQRCMATVSECIEVGGKILSDLRAAATEDCQIDFIPGNHDAWLSNYILDKAKSIYDITAYGEETPVWSFEKLFRLEEMGINIVGEPDTWPSSHIALTQHLIVHHGDVARKGSGASPLASMSGKDFAEIHGHTHRQSIVSRCVHFADGSTKIYQGGECGAMCKMEDGGFPTYTRHPDWQTGFCSVELLLDDKGNKTEHYSIDLATWQNSVLMWRGNAW